MKRTLFALAAALLATSLSAAIQTPSQFAGFEVGADRKLADYRQVSAYLRALDAASDRLMVESVGKTTLGEDMIMAVISSEANMRNLERIRETARKLADPRGLSDEQIVNDIYLASFSRNPKETERAALVRVLHAAEQQKTPGVEDARRAALNDMLWAMLTSEAFMFNH